MKTKFLIDVREDKHSVQVVGNPTKVLIELTSVLSKHKELSFIVEQALKFKEIMEEDFKIYDALHSDKHKNAKVNYHSKESFDFVAEFMEHYKR